MTPQSIDTLSTGVQQLLRRLDRPQTYATLVVREPPAPQELPTLEALAPHELFTRPVIRPDDARCALAGLWLWIDELDRSHALAQQIATPSGSFWHAILHRREGDFANSRYWYARCADHPVLRLQDEQAEPALRSNGTSVRRVTPIRGAALVDLVEQVHDAAEDDPRRDLAVRLQRQEWRLLFDHCARAAVER